MNVTVVNTQNIASFKAFNIGDIREIFSECLDPFLKADRVGKTQKVQF